MSSLAPESALTYLRDELGLTVERIQQALASYSERPEEKSELELAVSYLRQLKGALTMMGHHTGTRFAHEMVQLLDLIASGESKDFEVARDSIVMAALKLEPFIACLERGDRDGVGIDLASTVDQLRALRGKPPLSPPGDTPTTADPADIDRLLVRKLRPAYQRALAHVVRGTDVSSSLDRLLQVLEQVRDMAQGETPYRLWWSGCRLLSAMRQGWIDPGTDVVPLLGQLDRTLRDQIDLGKAAFAGERTLALLTRIEAKMRESAEAAALLDDQSDYRPPDQRELMPPAAPATDIETLRQVAANMVDDVSVAQDLVDRMAAGEEQQQDPVADLAGRLRTMASVLAMVNLGSSASLLARQSERLSENRTLIPAEIERLAADLVLVEDSLADLVDPAVALVEKEAEGNEPGLSPVKNRQARKAVAKQALENMVRLHELSLDLSWNRAEDLTWKDLSPTVHRVANVFAILGDGRAHELAERLRKVLEHPRTVTRAEGENEFMVALAEVMVALELHLRAEEGSELWNVQNLDRAEKCLDKLQDLLTESAAIAESLAETFDRDSEHAAQDGGAAFEELDSRGFGQTVGLSDPKLLRAFVDSIESEFEEPVDEDGAETVSPTLTDEVDSDADAAEGSAAAAEAVTPQAPAAGDNPQAHLEPLPEPDPPTVTAAEFDPLPEPEWLGDSLLPPEPEVADEPGSEAESVPLDAPGLSQAGLDPSEVLALFDAQSAEGADCATAPDAGAGEQQAAGPEAAWRDHEFLDVFLEEAEGEVACLREAIPTWVADPEDTETLGSIRRSFHTLKGSGRMVGAETAGEFGWALENLLNRVLEGTLKPTPALSSVLEQSLRTLDRLVERMNEGHEDVDIAPILAAVEALDAPEELEAGGPAGDLEQAAVGTENELQFEGESRSEVEPEASARDDDAAELLGERASGSEECPSDGAQTSPDLIRVGTPGVALEGADADSQAEAPGADIELSDSEASALPPDTGVVDDPGPETAKVAAEKSSRDAEPLSEFDPELADVFAQEATDILEAGDQILARWADGEEDASLLIEFRRGMHTLKGSSRMAGFVVIGDLAHAVESLLDDMSKGVVRLNPAIVAVLQQAVDRFHTMTATARGLVQPEPANDLVAALKDRGALTAPAGADAKPAPQGVAPEEPGTAVAVDSTAAVPVKPGAQEPAAAVADASDMVRVHADLLDRLANQTGETNIFRARIAQGVSNFDTQLTEMDQTIGRLSEKLRRLEIETEAQILFRYESGDDDDFEEFDPLELDRFSELQQLSRSLMEVVNDLTSIRNSLEEQNREMDSLLHLQEKVNRDIQDQLTRTRMVRFDGTLSRMRRVVRLAANDLGKRAELVMEGGGDMERGLLEHVLAPLEHILRNAVAHGLEDPETRRKAGKSSNGKIVMAMGREGSELVVSVRDDGAGINFEAVRNKAEQSGLLAPGADASREELLDCLMAPGFSTANSLTQVSGRGVGMDVVADSVRSLGGSLSIESEDGKGARFVMRLPFSLSLAHTLLVRAGGAVYAVPLAGIEAMARISPEDLTEYVDSGAAQIIYDDETYELHSLGALLGGSAPRGDNLDRWLPAMLVKTDTVKVALQVDAVIGSQETMVKPVGPLVNSVPGLSGATILPDGRVVLILEMAALVRSLVRRQARTEAVALRRAQGAEEAEALQVMVIDDSITMRKVTSKLLQRNGIKVHLAKDGLDAAAQLEDIVPDAIVLDIEMPRMDGFELAAHIRNREHLTDLPIIMVTSRTGEKHRERAARLSVQEYLGKPYREEELLAALRRVLGPRAAKLSAGNG